MTDVDLAARDFEGDEVYDSTGALLGTVGDVDEDAGVLFVDPDPDPNEETWAHVAENTTVNYDNNWLGVPDYKVWNAGEGGETEFEEWPYTVTVDEIGRVEDEGFYLESTSLTDLVEDVLPIGDSE